MRYYSLPLDFSDHETINCNNEILGKAVLDMHDLHFPNCTDQVRAALIYVRNMNLTVPMNFDKCTFEEKEKYLVLYMTTKLNINSPELLRTWLYIMHIRCDHKVDISSIVNLKASSILNSEECATFIENNKGLVTEMVRLSISTPLGAITFFMSNSGMMPKEDINQIEEYDYDKINIANFVKLVNYPSFIYLTEPIDGIMPVYYPAYFHQNNNPYLDTIIQALPHFDMLSYIFRAGIDNKQEMFVGAVGTILSGANGSNHQEEV